MNKNIVLCGFMGSGKSSVGKALSDRLNKEFIDIDAFIEEKEKMSVNEIFKTLGEEYFRKAESKAAYSLGALSNKIIACGGGTVLNPENVKALKENGELFYLSVCPDTVTQRLKNCTDRPLLAKDMENTVTTLLNKREPIYKSVCDFVIDANKPLNLVINQILEKSDKKED